jgi:hypothetical protein
MSEPDADARRELARRRLEHIFGGQGQTNIARNFGRQLLETADLDDPSCAAQVEMGHDLLMWAKDAL